MSEVPYEEAGEYIERQEAQMNWLKFAQERGRVDNSEAALIEKGFRRKQVLSRLEFLTGYKVRVTEKPPSTNTAAFVKSDGSKEIYLTESTLDDPDFSEYALFHEIGHIDSGLYVIPLSKLFKGDHSDVLAQTVQVPGLINNSTFWVEGFNDLITSEEHSGGSKSAYLQAEVPAAKKLEAHCLLYTGRSLKKMFKKGDAKGFSETLKLFADRLLMQKAAAELAEDPAMLEALNNRIFVEKGVDFENEDQAAEWVDDQISAMTIEELKRGLEDS